MIQKRILVIGAAGQIGVELVSALRDKHGVMNVIASDLHKKVPDNLITGPYESLDVLDKAQLKNLVIRENIDEVYHLAALLSATAEKYPVKGWDVNMEGLLNVLELGREELVSKIFWPSSIAVFGPSTPKENTPQNTIMDPTSVYGISKLAGERWCEYYYKNYGVDVRSIRYPGIISWKSAPGGGTTDYAINIFHEAIDYGKYECFLASSTRLPMMYMEDAIKATLAIMKAPTKKVKIRSSYNVASMSFTPAELAVEIQKLMPDFKISYNPDFRQEIAASWPASIDDNEARKDWGWQDNCTLETLTKDMLYKLREVKEIA